jgi:hypothetical protein
MKTTRSINLTGKLKRNRSTALASLLPLGLASFVCLRIWLDPDFVSMDYRPYLQVFEFIAQSSFSELIDNATANLPTPYILVNGSTTIELGFAAIVKILSVLGFLNHQIFSIIASFSILIHQYVLTKINKFSLINLFTFIYTTVLLETNAIRAGLSASLLLYLLYIGLIQRRQSALFFLPACFLIHVQSAAWVTAALAAFVCIKMAAENIVLRATLLLILIFSVTSVQFLFNLISPDKFDAYSGIVLKSSGWTPLNAFATVICVTSFWIVISWRPNPEDDQIWKYWICAFTTFFQSTIFLIYNTTFGAVGQRIWQFSFVVFLAVTSMCIRNIRQSLPPGFKYVQYSLALLLLLLCYNILFRYPLSNVFHPLTPSIGYEIY